MSDAQVDDMEEESWAEKSHIESKKAIDFYPSIVYNLSA